MMAAQLFGTPLQLTDDLGGYARRLRDLHAVQQQAGALMQHWHEGAGATAMTLAHQLAAQAAQIQAELARWAKVNFAMPAASLDFEPVIFETDAGCSCGWRGSSADLDEHVEVCPLPDPADVR